jgi:hypothetical protein
MDVCEFFGRLFRRDAETSMRDARATPETRVERSVNDELI